MKRKVVVLFRAIRFFIRLVQSMSWSDEPLSVKIRLARRIARASYKEEMASCTEQLQ